MELITTIVPALLANFPDDADRAVIEAQEWNNRFDLLTAQGNLSQNTLADIITTVNLHLTDHVNPHTVTKTQLGLGNVDNTSDANKPISDAAQIALDTKVDKVEGKGLVKVVQLGGLSTEDVMSQKAIVDYMVTLGGGDMLKAVYDPDDLGPEAFANTAAFLEFQEDTEAALAAVQTQINQSLTPLGTRVGNLATRVGNLETAIVPMLTTGNYATLNTTSKAIIGAINEVNTLANTKVTKSSASTISFTEIAIVGATPAVATQQANPTRLYITAV